MKRSVTMGVPSGSNGMLAKESPEFRRWMLALCAIRFDLEQGQVVESCYPEGAITPEEEIDVAFTSFPDSMSQGHNRTSVYDCMFFFRIRRRGLTSSSALGARTKSSPNPEKSEQNLVERAAISERSMSLSRDGSLGYPQQGPLRRVSRDASVSLYARQLDGLPYDESGKVQPLSRASSSEGGTAHPRQNSDQRNAARNASHGGPGSGGPRYLYGFVFNRQRKDERLKRGGEQKSVVILSERPYSNVFRSLLQILGPLYFDIGFRGLEQIANYVSHWPAPVHGALMELSVGNVSLRAHLPPAHTLPPGCGTPMDDFTSSMAPASPLNPSIPHGIFHEADVFGIFRGILMELWELWELVLIGEPLLVISPTPSQCCEAVAALVGLVAPLPCSVDFRPYFTIHDPDFTSLNSLKEGEPIPSMILGVTNLFFLKVMRSLPHVVSVGSSLSIQNKMTVGTISSIPNNTGGNNNLGRLQLQLSPLKKFSPTNLLKNARVKRDGPLCLMTEHREALWTNYDATTKPDTAVLNRLVDAGLSPRIEESMSLVNNDILRRHFSELTTNFLAPFGPYLKATAPQEGISPFIDPPSLLPFNAHEFLDGLGARGPGKFLSKRLRSNWLDLYRRFLNGPNFMPWFQRRRAVAEQEQHRVWRQARIKSDIRSFISKMSEVEVIESFNAVERHLLAEIQTLQATGMGSTDSLASQKLRSDLRAIYNALPMDMQQLLLFNPQKAALLQGSKEFSKLPGRLSVLVSRATDSSAANNTNSDLGKLSHSQELSLHALDLERN